MSIITIVGAGMMGSAMCFPAADNGHEVRLVGIRNRVPIDEVKKSGYHPMLKCQLPAGVKAYHIDGLKEAMEGADLIISGVSSFGVPWFEENVLPLLPEGTPVLSVTKGLEALPDGLLVSFPAAMTARAGKKVSINAVGGPVISFELAARQQTEIAFCGTDIETLRKLKSMLQTDYYHISVTTDVAGLECAVAMKNAYALGVALAIGLNEKLHGEESPERYNPQAALVVQSTREVMKLMKLVHAQMETLPFFSGDLYVTVFGGRTRRIGVLLGKGYTYEEAKGILAGVTLESVAIATIAANAIRKMDERGLAKISDFPLLMHIDGIINHGEAVNIPWSEFEKDNTY
jgi:glycerol-3-phosphate dehydrogenase (NAD(P)+)